MLRGFFILGGNTLDTPIYPFSAIVGQERLKQALILNAVNPAIGGVLIRGEKGTAKSTAVRGLAALLPEIRIIGGSPISCAPDRPDEWQDSCRTADPGSEITVQRMPVVTLPLNATEDRVVGGIDFNQAVRRGVRGLAPGLLARAHHGFLYVDEVNLLDDPIVDLILDAAGTGVNRVEREGLSFSHPACFILVGTMNPEEGELRPQFLDRFGLCVAVASESDPEKRVELMERREAFDSDPVEFIRRYQTKDVAIAQEIQAARQALPQVVLGAGHRSWIAAICTESHVAGHRADLIMEQTARALAALDGRGETTVADIQEAAALALPHRRQAAAPPPPPSETDASPDQPPETESENPQTPPENPDPDHLEPEPPPSASAGPERQPAEMEAEGTEQGSVGPHWPDEVREQIFEIGETFKVKPLGSPRDRVFRRGSGRRSRTWTARKQGRYIKSALPVKSPPADLALDATLRAAAPYQIRRKNSHPNGLAVVLQGEDLREKIREKRAGNLLLFLVDASGSMGAKKRMAASKGAIISLLLDAYQKRDRVAMVSFRKSEAVVNLPPTSSVELAASLLREMPVGGRTPLSAGLVKSHQMVRNCLLRDPAARPIVILITDGRSNVALGEKPPMDEALSTAEKLSSDPRIRFIVVDTESDGWLRFGLARKLAAVMNADYFSIADLKADTLLNITKEST